MTVPGIERWKIGRHQVDLAVDRLRLARLEPADAKVGMGADDDALEELLKRFPGGGDEFFSIGGNAADEAVRGDDQRQGTRVDIVSADAGRAPDLAGSVRRFLRPRFDRQTDGLAIDVDETMRQVGFAVWLELRTGVSVDSNARLSPVCLRGGGGGIACDDPEIDFIAARHDLVVDHDAVLQERAQMNRPASRVHRDKLGLVRNHGPGPIASCRARPAKGLDVPDFEQTAGKMVAMDGEDLFIPGKRERTLRGSRGGREWENRDYESAGGGGRCDQAANQGPSLTLSDGVGRTGHFILPRIRRRTICA